MRERVFLQLLPVYELVSDVCPFDHVSSEGYKCFSLVCVCVMPIQENISIEMSVPHIRLLLKGNPTIKTFEPD